MCVRACDDSDSGTQRRQRPSTQHLRHRLTGLRATSQKQVGRRQKGRELTVNQLAAVVHDPLDRALLLQVPNRNARETAVNLQTLDEDALADEAEGRDLLDDTVERRLVEDDGVLRLVLDLALGPLLLLCGLAAAGGRGCCLSLGL